jgi:hypothetical protein
MRVPLIGTLEANACESGPFPALDAQAKIIYTAADGDNRTTLSMDKVNCMDVVNGRNEICFNFDEPNPDGWEITFTDERITFWHPLFLGLFGKKPKSKLGKCTAGHLYYKSIGMLSTGYLDANRPFLAMMCIRYDGTGSSVLLLSRDFNNLKNAALTLQARISTYLEETGLPQSENYKEGWAKFSETIWSNPDKDIRVSVPSNGIEKVHNSRISATSSS